MIPLQIVLSDTEVEPKEIFPLWKSSNEMLIDDHIFNIIENLKKKVATPFNAQFPFPVEMLNEYITTNK